MILKKLSGKDFIVNLLSDFIIDKLDKESSSIIKVIDLENFFVIKGKTSSKNVLNLSETIDEFTNKFNHLLNDIKITNIIDLIQYDHDLKVVNDLTITLHNTENCIYHYKQIDYFKENNESVDFDFFLKKINDNSVSVSHFPHGYSLNQGRSLYYLMKKIFYSIPSTYPITSVTLTIDKSKENDDIIEVYNNFYNDSDDILKSSILDHHDFNINEIIEKIKKVDWSFELTNPLEEYSFLKDNKKMEII